MNEPIQSAEEALTILNQCRKELILKGRALARRICIEEGTVHSRRIYKEMKEEIERSGVGCYWLGCLFTKKEFEWTGEWHRPKPALSGVFENYHGGAGVRIWRLKEGLS